MDKFLDHLAVAITVFVATLVVGFGSVVLVMLVIQVWPVLLLFAGVMLVAWALQRTVEMDDRRRRGKA